MNIKHHTPWSRLLAALFILLLPLLALPLRAGEATPGLLGIAYGDSVMKKPDGSATFNQADNRAAAWPSGNDYALSLRGLLTAPVTGQVTLRIETSQPARLWFDGHQILVVASGVGSATVDCRAGEARPIMLEYVQTKPPALLRLTWQLPERAFEAIPASALSHDDSDLAALEAAGVKPAVTTLLEVANPDPAQRATLSVLRSSDDLVVRAAIPSVPAFVCDAWCYEGDMKFVSCRDLGGGRLELRHRLTATPGVLVVTDVTPGADTVDFRARLEREDGADGPWPEQPVVPNLCWQLKRSPAFASRPDPYPQFVARCFIFTAQGRVFLDQTDRQKIPALPTDDPRNNPPWIELYGTADQPPMHSEPGDWADYSADRFTLPIVGAVSRDGKYLAAIAGPSAATLCQAWHDCMHIDMPWGSSGQRTWRLKIYAMANDPAKLLQAVSRDFPEIPAQGSNPTNRE